ncbi:MAG: hypothetical protein AD742_11130 [Methylibium sp. NZG]|nr:MAG: hypothetical protein AD742_11130 [Methylibium sp. NZG]
MSQPLFNLKTTVATLLLAGAMTGAPAQPTAGSPAAQSPEWSFGARVQLDHSRFNGVYSRDGAWHGATYLRRANLEAGLRWHPQWRASAELELDSDTRLTLNSATVAWEPRDGLALRLGRIDPDFGLEPSSSSSWTFGIERSAIWDLAPDVADANEGAGLRVDLQGKAFHGWHASAGLYDKRGHRAAVARATGLLFDTPGGRLHVGASLATSQGWRDDGRIRTRLAVRGVTENDLGRRSTFGEPAVPPAAFDSDTAFGVEVAWQHGPGMLQAEALQRRLGGTGGQAGRTAQGAYVLAAWSLTGEPRRYDDKRGRFRGAKPADARWGAWEVFYRLDRLAVNDGGSATVHTAGLGWTATDTWRGMLNVHRAQSDDANALGQTTGRGLSVRLQALF